MIIRAEIKNPPNETEIHEMSKWFKNLVKEIDMKILMGPYITYHDVPGNRGMTGVAVIETSHIAMHVWDEGEIGLLQLDVYTCGFLDPFDVVKCLEWFEPEKIEMKYLDRENGLTELPIE